MTTMKATIVSDGDRRFARLDPVGQTGMPCVSTFHLVIRRMLDNAAAHMELAAADAVEKIETISMHYCTFIDNPEFDGFHPLVCEASPPALSKSDISTRGVVAARRKPDKVCIPFGFDFEAMMKGSGVGVLQQCATFADGAASSSDEDGTLDKKDAEQEERDDCDNDEVDDAEVAEEPPPLPPPPDLPGPQPQPLPQPPDAPARRELMGLKNFDVAATSRSVCHICSANIMVGTLRFTYRFKESRIFSDERGVHAHCLTGLPACTRAEDVVRLRAWALQEGHTHEQHEKFENVIASLAPAGFGGSSGSAG